MIKKVPYPEDMVKRYPPGATPDKRKIIRCSIPDAWYKNKIGKIITVHYFVTFGCWDTKGRWVDYYDLSSPIPSLYRRWIKKLILLFKKLFGK